MEGPPKKKRRGGHQQRLAQQKDEPEGDGRCETSALCLLLLNLFAWGYFRPQRVQQIAEMAVKDIEKSKEDPRILEDLYTLAKLGTKGKHANNIHAELMSRVEHVPKIPRPFKAAVPLKGFLNSVQSMLLPHEMFSCVYTHYRQVWNTAILPSIDRMQRFWRAMRLHPQFQEHPLKSKPNWDRTTIPIAMHGDGVPVTGIGKIWSRVMTNYSWYSLLGQGTTPSMLIWVWGFFDKLKIGDQTTGTLFEFYTVLKWSFSCLAEGTWPSVDHKGRKQLSAIQIVFFFVLCWFSEKTHGQQCIHMCIQRVYVCIRGFFVNCNVQVNKIQFDALIHVTSMFVFKFTCICICV